MLVYMEEIKTLKDIELKDEEPKVKHEPIHAMPPSNIAFAEPFDMIKEMGLRNPEVDLE